MYGIQSALCFLSLVVSALGGPLPGYKPEPLKVVFDKSAKYYQKYNVPEKEKAFTKDLDEGPKGLREVDLNGVKFSREKPLIITPALYPNPSTPYEAVAAYLGAVQTGDSDKVLAIHDSASGRFLDSSVNATVGWGRFFEMNKAIREVKVMMVFETNGLIIVYGFNVFDDYENLHPWALTKVGTLFKKKTGLIDIGFLGCLGGSLQTVGTSVIKREK